MPATSLNSRPHDWVSSAARTLAAGPIIAARSRLLGATVNPSSLAQRRTSPPWAGAAHPCRRALWHRNDHTRETRPGVLDAAYAAHPGLLFHLVAKLRITQRCWRARYAVAQTAKRPRTLPFQTIKRKVVMSRFTEKLYRNAQTVTTGMVTGEPHNPVRHTWGEVHQRARRIAGGLASAGVGRGDAVGVLVGAPVDIAPTAQAVWMRGASLTMLHQPTARTDLMMWVEGTTKVINMITTNTVVVVSDPFLATIPVLHGRNIPVLTVAQLLAADPIEPG